MPNKIDSNATSCFIAEEVSGTPKVLPGTPVWYEQEPNSYSDFGGQISSVARDTINVGRQRKRGTITDLDASGGFNSDHTQNNMTRLLQGFFFADAGEKFDTMSLNSSAITITNIDGTDNEFDAASGLDGAAAGDILLGSGFTQTAANGLHVVQSVTSDTNIETDVDLVDETPTALARLQTVGYQFSSGDLSIAVASGIATLSASSKDMSELGLRVGEWIYIGGDAAAEKFATCPSGYARVLAVADDGSTITLDKVSATFVTDAGSSKTIQIFFGKFIRNENTAALIKARTYNVERQLGNDGVGVQSEYLEGAIANELTLNVPQADKLNSDLNFIAMDHTFRTGTVGVKSGTRVSELSEDPYNTSRDIYRLRMNIIDSTTLEPTALFAYVTEATITVNNNASLAKAVGVLGGFDITVGTFEVGGSVTAYFSDVTAVQAVRNNSDVTLDIIAAKDNTGIVYDVPMLGLGGGRTNIEKDQPITIPLDTLAAESDTGYTLGVTVFPYLPNGAMPL